MIFAYMLLPQGRLKGAVLKVRTSIEQDVADTIAALDPSH